MTRQSRDDLQLFATLCRTLCILPNVEAIVSGASEEREFRLGGLGVRHLGVKVETTIAEDLQAERARFGVPVTNGGTAVGTELGAESAAMVSVVIEDAAVYRGSMDPHNCDFLIVRD